MRTLRRHIPLIIACACIIAVFAAVTHWISASVIQHGVNDIETRHAVEDMNQLRSYLRIAEQRMHQHMVDWACWDEAYSFMDSRDQAFILNNFDQNLLDELHIAGAGFYDLSGALVTFVDGTGLARGEHWSAEEQRIFEALAKVVLQGGMESLDGFASVLGDGMVIAAHKVFDGNKFKPAKGLLVMGKILDGEFMEEAEKITRLHFSVLPVSAFGEVRVPGERGSAYKIVQSADAIHVHSIIYDVFGNAAFDLRLRRERSLAILGRRISQKNFWLILGLGIFILLAGVTLLLHVQRRIMRREVAYRISHDSLTGLPTKGLFQERLRSIMEDVSREKSCAGVLFIDLDRFKGVNDRYGHSRGDRVLQETATRLHAFGNGCVARSGGDEFLVAVAAAGPDQVERQAHALLDALDRPFIVDGRDLRLGACTGIALYPGHGDSAEVLLHRAELAMYAAKEKGRDSLAFFEQGMEDAASRRVELETALYRALQNGALTVHYQPKVDAASRDVAGCEALVRWQTGDGAWVPPPVFIPLAEESGLVTDIDMFVLRSACRQVGQWERDGSGVVPVAVNMSARSILSEGFAGRVMRILEEEGTPPSRIEVEITESCFLTDMEAAFSAIERLHAAGIRIALDDFGTGYSSLQYLSAMPISCLKIDKKFVDDIFSSKATAQPLIRSIIALAANLGMSTVSEGVEDRRQMEFLLANGACVIQGYLFSRPLSGTDCGEFLRDRRGRIAAVFG